MEALKFTGPGILLGLFLLGATIYGVVLLAQQVLKKGSPEPQKEESTN